MTLDEIDHEIAAQQRRLCDPAIRTKQDVDRVRRAVEKRVAELQSQRRKLVEGGERA